MVNILRVRSTLGGAGVVGGGVGTLFFIGEDQTAANGAAAAVRTMWNSLSSHIGGGVTIQVDSDVDLLDPTTDPPGQPIGTFSTTSALVTTSGAGDPLPLATQGLIRMVTPIFVGGRQIRGRLFLPCPVEGESTAGVPTSAYITAVNSAAAALISSSAGTFPWCVFSRTHKIAPQVSGAQCWTQWAVMRSRRD